MARKAPALSPLHAALKQVCPACGKGKLYEGVLQVKEHCDQCHFPLKQHDAADGPAYIAIMVIGTLVTLLAVWVEFRYAPAPWVHLLIWPPVTVLGCIGLMRLAKAWLMALQYRHTNVPFK